MRKNDPSVNGHYNPVKAKENGWPIRLSKSSFMTYLQCPRKYWWQKVEMEGIRTPPTEYMIHGTAVHKSLENLYANLENIEDIDVLEAQDMRLLFDKDPEKKKKLVKLICKVQGKTIKKEKEIKEYKITVKDIQLLAEEVLGINVKVL